MKAMRERFISPLLFVLVVGCKSEKSDGAATAPSAPSEAAASAQVSAPAAETAPASDDREAAEQADVRDAPRPAVPPASVENAPSADGRRAALETAWRARACLLKRQDRTGGDAIDRAGGYKDAADFTAQWAAAAAADPAWATRVMTEAVMAGCEPASN